jgi:pimeloyl-ACP methyl ester carboxylesterase
MARRLLCRGHHVYFEVHGPEGGRAVVLLHHGLGSVRAWKSQIPALVSAGFQVMAYDRWGYGASDPRPSLDLPGFGADLLDLEELLDAAGMARAALIGHSDGGTMALYFASRRPERVWALVTIAAHIYVEPAMTPRMISIGQTYGGDRELREKLERAHGEMTDQVFRNWYEGWFNPRHLEWDMRPLLGQIVCPALVIQGEQDEDASPQHARDLASGLASARLWLVPGARHMVPQEAPEEFNHRVVGFLEESLQGGSRLGEA